ncbi:hypothetical protein JXQ31_17925 [candidate division KSB1 bacterium]|nr:hypothetical protein [candidate division KSB1 bacterium]
MDFFNKSCFYLVFILLIIGNGFAQDKSYFERGNIGAEYGIWKPSTLDNNQTKPFKNIKGAGPYYGVSVTSPSLQSYALRISYNYWRQKGLEERANLSYVSLRHLSIELKNYILTQSRICPYVNYGVAAIWSREVPVGSDKEKIPLDRAGFGINVGAGANIYLFSKWAVAVEYFYLYARFAEKVGLTDNYSGPKLSFKLNFLF